MTTHIVVAGASLCRPRSMTCLANSSDCQQCNRVVEESFGLLIEVVKATQKTEAAMNRAISKVEKFLAKHGFQIADNEEVKK